MKIFMCELRVVTPPPPFQDIEMFTNESILTNICILLSILFEYKTNTIQVAFLSLICM